MAQTSKGPETFKLRASASDKVLPFSEAEDDLLTTGRVLALQSGFGLIGEGISGFTEFGNKIAQVKDIRFAAKQEKIKGKQIAGNLLEEFNNMQASNIVTALAQGRQLTGSVVSINQELGLKAARSISVAKLNSEINFLRLNRRADHLEALARWDKKVAPFKIISGAALAWAGASFTA